MTGKHTQTKNELVKNIVSELKKNLPAKEQDAHNLNLFIKECYRFLPDQVSSRFTAASLFGAAKSLFNFISQREKGQSKVRIYNPSQGKHGWESPYTVVEIANDDMPFLVDSLTEELARHELKVHLLVHPVLEIKRTAKGYVSTLSAVKEVKAGENAESIVQFYVSKIDDSKALDALEKDLQRVLDAVRYAVEDWQDILAKVNEVIVEFPASSEMLSAMLKGKEQQKMAANVQEIKEFFEWLKKDNFVFLGYVEYTATVDSMKLVPASRRGIFKIGDSEIEPKHNKKITSQELLSSVGSRLIEITKANKKSLVHRPVHMDYIIIKRIDAKGQVVGEHRFLGMFTSIAYHQNARNIPIIRQKMEAVERRSGFAMTGHSGKALMAILQDLPRDELFQASEDFLYDAAIGIESLSINPRVRLFVREDHLGRFMSCLIYIPRERMSTGLRVKMEEILKDAFNGTVSNYYAQITQPHFARLLVIVKTAPDDVPNYKVEEIEKRLALAATSWEDQLKDELDGRLAAEQSEQMLKIYQHGFSLSYKNRFSVEDAYYDIKMMQKVLDTKRTSFDLYQARYDKELLHLKIYSPNEQIPLSSVMPMLDNMGLHTLDEHTYLVTPSGYKDSVWVHRFRFTVTKVETLNLWNIKDNFEQAMDKVWHGEVENDGLNRLILWADMKWHHVVILRAFSKYLQQASFNYSQAFIQEALGNHPKLAADLVEFFYIRFDPEFSGKRDDALKQKQQYIEEGLGHVANLSEDRVLRAILELMLATVRTNAFQSEEGEPLKYYLSFKLQSERVSFLPKPKPFAEIFVCSPKVEGVHLRGGKVARGGLRWSDRREDFRTEILGLMKAQMTKNSVIIPVGSKGGFVVKQPPLTGDRQAFINEGIECYKTFLRGLLDVTDNRVGRGITGPDRVVCHDDEDPYLVVAADKGTATFSDIANAVSEEYNFWLGDAFASGGSVGYDHKKMGITAGGAWISVQRHFGEMGVDVQKESFTVLGIGDMSGDVFGNGMLMSKHIKLVAAFNHLHIFIDPNPDAAVSFKERKRLFNLSRSGWGDYKQELISQGGGVFSRSDKTIKLSKEIKALLDVSDVSLSPDDLIKALLKAQIDLIWNGGIGTYVKAKHETHEDVGDKANDVLRVNGHEVRAKVIGEGGNLGLTQLGRVEYALSGGRINTDAVDNSAGVDCSDHEVNIKIALRGAVDNKKLSQKDRDTLLESMTDEVAQLVLQDNFLQTQSLTIAEHQGNALLSSQAKLIHFLEKQGILDRELEFLPNEEAIAHRHSQGKGLVRPELAVILSYSKLNLYDKLLESKLPDDRHFKEDLIRYFPEAMHETYRSYLENHPLKREIVATSVTNSLINRLGAVRFYNLREETGMKVCDIARSYAVTRDVFGLREICEDIEALGYDVAVEDKVALFVEMQDFSVRNMLWFLRHCPIPLDVSTVVNTYVKGIHELADCVVNTLPEKTAAEFSQRLNRYLAAKTPIGLAHKIAAFELMYSACDIVSVALKAGLPVKAVAKVYYELGECLDLAHLRGILDNKNPHSYWEKSSISTLISELFDEQSRLTSDAMRLLCDDNNCKDPTQTWLSLHFNQIQRYKEFMDDFKTQEEPDISMIIVAIRKLKDVSPV